MFDFAALTTGTIVRSRTGREYTLTELVPAAGSVKDMWWAAPVAGGRRTRLGAHDFQPKRWAVVAPVEPVAVEPVIAETVEQAPAATRNVVSVNGGKVHSLAPELLGAPGMYPAEWPECRTFGQTNAGTAYRFTDAPVDCRTCVAQAEMRAARTAHLADFAAEQAAPVVAPVVISHVRIAADDSAHVRNPDRPSLTLCRKNVGGPLASTEGMDHDPVCATKAAKLGMVTQEAEQAAEQAANAANWWDVHQAAPVVEETAPETRTEYAVKRTIVQHGRLQTVLVTMPGYEDDLALNVAAVDYVRHTQAGSAGPVDAVLVSRTVIAVTPWVEVEETPLTFSEIKALATGQEPAPAAPAVVVEEPASYAVMIREELIDADRTEHADPAMVALVEQVMLAKRRVDYLTREEFGDVVLKALDDVDEMYGAHKLRDYCREHGLAIPAWARRP